MRSECLKKWSKEPRNVKLMNFLIEKTKDAGSPISIKKLTTEFREKFHPSQSYDSVVATIKETRSKIYYLDDIDSGTKVKLLFALSIPVNEESIKTSITGKFGFDKSHRIIHFESTDGKLKLDGNHLPRGKEGVTFSTLRFRNSVKKYFENRGQSSNGNLVPIQNAEDQDTENLINFIFDKCKSISRPLMLNQFLEDLKASCGFRRKISTLRVRLDIYFDEIENVENFDIPTKVKQLFGLSASLNKDCLEKLRQNAFVKVDRRNRIIEYKSKNGSLHLQGKQDGFSKVNQTSTEKSKNRPVPTDSDDDESEEDFEEELSDDSDHEFDSNSDNENHPILSENDDEDETGVSGKRKRRSRRQRHSDEESLSEESDSNDFQSTSAPRTARRSSKITGSNKTASTSNIKTSGKTINKRKAEESCADSLKRCKKSTKHHQTVTKKVKKRPVSTDFKDESSEEDSDHKFRRRRRHSDDDSSSEDLDSTDFQCTSSSRTALPRHSSRTSNSRKTLSASNINTPRQKENKRETDKSSADIHKRARKSTNAPPPDDEFRPDDLEDYDPNTSSVHSNLVMTGGENDDERDGRDHLDQNKVKLEVFRGTLQETVDVVHDDDIQEIPRRVEASNASESDDHIEILEETINSNPRILVKQEPEALIDVKPSAMTIQQPVVKQEPTSSAQVTREVKQEPTAPAQVPVNTGSETLKITLCRALKSLAVTLEKPMLASFLSGVEKRIQRYEGSFERKQNNLVTLFLQACITEVSNGAVEGLPDSQETVGLSDFLMCVRSLVVMSELKGLEDVLEKINKLKSGSQNKRVPVEKVSKALTTTLQNLC